MSLLKFINDEPTTLAEICTVRPKPLPIGEDVNEDIVIDEIDRGQYCPVCNMLTTGLPCGDERCPW